MSVATTLTITASKKKYSLTGSFCEDLLKYLFFLTNIEDNFTIKFLVISTKFKFGNQLRIVDDIEREPFIVNVVVALVMDKIKFLSIFYLKKSLKIYGQLLTADLKL